MLNILIAYPYMNDALIKLVGANRDRLRLLLDSGAFTAWKSGKPIALDDYCRFLERLHTTDAAPWRYFVLDVIGDPVGTMKNLDTMVKRGFKPVPIFTRGDDPKRLKEFYAVSDLVGVGGLVRTRRNRGYVNGIMKHINGRPVHLLGFSDIPFLKFYRPYSCDSSGWDQGSYGQIRLYMGSGRFVYVRQQQCRDGALPDEVCRRFRFYGVEPTALARVSGWRGNDGTRRRWAPAYLASCRGMVHASTDIEANLGTMYFFAAGSSSIEPLLAAMERSR